MISAFINNTAAVAIFLPVTIALARRHALSASRLLMPLSFASIVGGTCTLIGTSTNILVSSLAARHGMAEFSMFELSKLGIVFLISGLLYLVFAGRRLLPDRPSTTLTRKYKLARYLTGLVVNSDSKIIGKMIGTGCLKLQEAYEAIDWFVIFLLAGMIPLGIAMERTGTADLIASGILDLTSAWRPAVVLSAFYLLITIFSSVMSHNAAAVVLVPIGIVAAHGLGVDARPFLVAITFAASSSLATPFGYHTNLMVYTPGGYRFSDYLKVGVPLNLMFWVLATLLIPIIWPL